MLRRIACGIAVAVTTIGLCTTPANAAETPTPTHYYLALGDSLAAGVQPIYPFGTHEAGYVRQVSDALSTRDPGLETKYYGCPGETTGSMLTGTACADDYPQGGSQIDAAVAFLRAHGPDVSLVTLDIGANDVGSCLAGGAIDMTCMTQALAGVATNLAQILFRLRTVAPHVRMVAMTYYDPYLAAWLSSPDGPALAQQSLQLASVLNGLLTLEYTLAGADVADVAGAFGTNDMTTMVDLPGFGQVPANVARICTWTWMCVTYPPDIHANGDGYQAIADAFLAKL